MFDALSDKLQEVFRNLRGLGKITESNIADALRQVRLALLEADVNYQVVRDFIQKVKEKSLGMKVIQSVQPGQQIIKVIHDEMVALLGGHSSTLDLQGNPAVIMLIGLHGSGKTTSAAKLARYLTREGRAPLLVAADVYRPAAIDQLESLGRQVGVPVVFRRDTQDVLRIAQDALDKAKELGRNVLIVDTAGRLHIDEELIAELQRLRDFFKPSETLLVLDAATGQEAVNVARRFNETVGITGAILTKLDGDARGGAALSFRVVVDRPIKFAGVGEKVDDFELFDPERMTNRILGMGDVVAFVEKAAEMVDEEEARRLEEKMRKGQFTLEDFLVQLRQMRKLGSLETILGMLPGGNQMLGKIDVRRSERELRRMEGIICAMTPEERRNPRILNARRRQRIARGSGVTVAEVNNLLNRFAQMQKMMKKVNKLQKLLGRAGGRLPPGLFPF